MSILSWLFPPKAPSIDAIEEARAEQEMRREYAEHLHQQYLDSLIPYSKQWTCPKCLGTKHDRQHGSITALFVLRREDERDHLTVFCSTCYYSEYMKCADA